MCMIYIWLYTFMYLGYLPFFYAGESLIKTFGGHFKSVNKPMNLLVFINMPALD